MSLLVLCSQVPPPPRAARKHRPGRGAHTGAMLQLELVQQIAQHHAASPAQVLYRCLGEQQTREEQDGAGYLVGLRA